MDDQGLVTALYCGPQAYIAPEVWNILVKEASRRDAELDKVTRRLWSRQRFERSNLG